ncbi:MAG: class I SAM-dependent methyltransferase [Gammaproteobacteria bacterium]|nr:class I SAM-dependent methyltransferase [Gammaproteobacteria bacterium]
MTDHSLRELYRPTHDEAARQRFVGVLKGFANGALEAQLADRYTSVLEPQFRAQHGRAPADREEGTSLFEPDPVFQLWGSMVYASQSLMWETVGETCQRILPEFEARAEQAMGSAGGSLSLQPELTLPEPIAHTEIHRQPGGYFASRDDRDMHAGLLYFGTVELYRAAKGLSANAPVGEPGMARYILSVLKKHYPDLKPRRILDLGCGPATETVGLKQAFPDAEVHGLDLSAPFVRFGHAWAEDQGLALHLRQADASDTGYDDGHFDLVVSHILFHETWHDVLPEIFSEVRRILAPGGVFLNADVPYQPERLSIPRQVTNHWQVRNNGEPFWSGFADTSVPEQLAAAGFTPDEILATYEPLGAGSYYFFGGRKAGLRDRRAA